MFLITLVGIVKYNLLECFTVFHSVRAICPPVLKERPKSLGPHFSRNLLAGLEWNSAHKLC
jgi:hypothetical protein